MWVSLYVQSSLRKIDDRHNFTQPFRDRCGDWTSILIACHQLPVPIPDILDLLIYQRRLDALEILTGANRTLNGAFLDDPMMDGHVEDDTLYLVILDAFMFPSGIVDFHLPQEGLAKSEDPHSDTLLHLSER